MHCQDLVRVLVHHSIVVTQLLTIDQGPRYDLSAMVARNPVGYTGYEMREIQAELGAGEHVWVEDESLVFEMPLDDEDLWVVTARYDLSHLPRLEAVTISPMHIYPTPPPLTSAVIRKVRISALEKQARDWVSIRREMGLAIEADQSEFLLNRRPGKVGRSDHFYARVAYRYLELVRAGPSPTRALADERHISQSSARDLVHEARARGLLTSMGRGQAGGHLTDKARTLLQSDQGAV